MAKKKKVVSRRARVVIKAARRSPAKRTANSFSWRRIIIFGSVAALLYAVFIVPNKTSVSQSVAGLSIMKGMYNQTTIALPSVNGAVGYNIYYKISSDSRYTNAVRNIPTNMSSYTISYLKKGAVYQYKISALDLTGREFWWSNEKQITDLSAM